MVTDDKKREIDEIVDQLMQDPEKRRAVQKALLDKADRVKTPLVEDDDDDLWDNLPI